MTQSFACHPFLANANADYRLDVFGGADGKTKWSMSPQAAISAAANGVFSFDCKPNTDCTFQTETSLCEKAPEAAFSLYVIANFGTYLNAVENAIDNVAGITDDASKNMQDTFKSKDAVSTF